MLPLLYISGIVGSIWHVDATYYEDFAVWDLDWCWGLGGGMYVMWGVKKD